MIEINRPMVPKNRQNLPCQLISSTFSNEAHPTREIEWINKANKIITISETFQKRIDSVNTAKQYFRELNHTKILC